MAQAVIDTTSSLERGDILKALRLLKRGDFSVRLPMDLGGIDGEIATAFNDVVELNDVHDRRVRAPARNDRPRRSHLRARPPQHRQRQLVALYRLR